MKLDNLTPAEREAYDEWNSADHIGGDCQGIGYAWAAFDATDEPAIILREDDQGFVDARTFSAEEEDEYRAIVDDLRRADEAYDRECAEEEARDEALLEAADELASLEEDETGACDSCEALMVNGVRTHEHGCPRYARIQEARRALKMLEA